MKTRDIRILTRDSFLALAQTIQVSDFLLKKGYNVKVKALKTSGDIKLDAPLYQIARQSTESSVPVNSSDSSEPKEGKAFFTKELEDGLLNNEGDLAIHSLKDLPTRLPEGLVFSSAIMPVECTDTLVTLEKIPESPERQLEHLKSLLIGTSSLRRIAIIKKWLPEARLLSVRGNLVTRLEKLIDPEGIHGLILATAGLKRLYAFYKLWQEKRNEWLTRLDHGIIERIDTDFKRLTAIFTHKLYFYELDPEVFPPAVSQGVLGVESRFADQENLENLFDRDTLLDSRIELERSLLSQLEAGCHIPFGNYVQTIKSKLPHFQISLFYARNYDPEKTSTMDFFNGRRNLPQNFTEKNIKTLVKEIRGHRFPVVFCGLGNDDIMNSLRQQKFSTCHIPLIKIQPTLSNLPLDDHYKVGVVVSKSSIDFFPENLPKIDFWVSVGEKTGEYLRQKKNISNIAIPEINDGFSAAQLVQKITQKISCKVLWMGALNGKKDGIELLKNDGYNLTVYEGYETVFEDFKLPVDETSEENFLSKTAWWVFSSPSSVESYLAKKLYRSHHLISVIGKSTAEIFFSNGITPYHISGKSDFEVMAEEIAGRGNQKKWKTIEWSL